MYTCIAYYMFKSYLWSWVTCAAPLLKANGEDVATVQALMRHANVSVTMNTYVQAVTPAKRKA